MEHLNIEFMQSLDRLNFEKVDSCINVFENLDQVCLDPHQTNFFKKNIAVAHIYRENEDSALIVLNSIKTDSAILNLTVLLLKSQIFTQRGLQDSVIQAYQKSVRIFQELQDTSVLVKFTNYYANQLMSLNNNLARDVLLRTAPYLETKHYDSASYMSYYGTMAALALNDGNYSKSFDYFEKELTYISPASKATRAFELCTMSQIAQLLEIPKTSLNLIAEAERLIDTIPTLKELQVLSKVNKALSLHQLGAMTAFENEAEKLWNKKYTFSETLHAFDQNRLFALLHQYSGRFSEAILYRDANLEIAQKRGDSLLLVRAYSQKAQTLFKQKRSSEAAQNFKKAFLYVGNNNKPYLSDYQDYYDFLMHSRMDASGVKSIINNIEIELKDQLFADKLELILLQNRIKTEKLVNKANSEKIEAVRLKNKSLKQRNRLFGAAIILLTVLGFMLFNYFKLKQKSSKVEARNTKLELEKTISGLNYAKGVITEKNQLINELKDYLKIHANSGAFADNLMDHISNDNNWTAFLTEFEILYKDFFKNLKRDHSKITNNDLRLAALIKLNLSDKEISALLNVELSTTKKAKNRLKKKLNLGAERKLFDYIATY